MTKLTTGINGDMAKIIGDSIAREIAEQEDRAFFQGPTAVERLAKSIEVADAQIVLARQPDDVVAIVTRDLYRGLAAKGPVVAIHDVSAATTDHGTVEFKAEATVQRPNAIQRLRRAIENGTRKTP